MTERRVGRPRSESARVAALTAARELVESRGYPAVTLVQIADTAGIGRQTIYRWWPSKEALVAEAVLTDALTLDTVIVGDSGDLAHDLHIWVEASIARIAEGDAAALYRGLLAASALDDDAAARMSERLADPLRETIRTAFIATGRGAVADAAADILIGVMSNALVTRDAGARERIADVVDLVVRGSAPAA